jgi:hypothetical protein
MTGRELRADFHGSVEAPVRDKEHLVPGPNVLEYCEMPFYYGGDVVRLIANRQHNRRQLPRGLL